MYKIEDVVKACQKSKGVDPEAIIRFPHPSDNFLFLVLIETDPDKFVTWIYNAQTNGFSNGSYFTGGFDQRELRIFAYEDLIERIKGKLDLFKS